MEVQVTAQGDFQLPKDCYASLRYGDVSKLVKFDGKCSFSLPEAQLNKQACQIEFFQCIGSCNAQFDVCSSEPFCCKVVTKNEQLKDLKLCVSATEAEKPPPPPACGGAFVEMFNCWSKDKVKPMIDMIDVVQTVEASSDLIDQPKEEQGGVEDECRMAVLTDVGEEIDDEAALWLLHQHLSTAQNIVADVVFVTGVPLQRATRWATIISSMGKGTRLQGKVNYYAGPQSDRHMRYRLWSDGDLLRDAGMQDIISRPFDGGQYDVVLQISPLGGFSENFESPPKGSTGALGRIEPRPGAKGHLHIIVGGEGSTNFPRDALHLGFKTSLEKKGFQTVHVSNSNYMNWRPEMFESFPPKLIELVLDDEWNKAVGRIPPFAANLFVRFRVNTLVNYDVVDRAFASFEKDYRVDPSYVRATKWWSDVTKNVTEMIAGYIKLSRQADDKAGDLGFGNMPISSTVKGQKITWESLLSRFCIKDILGGEITETSLPTLCVDTVLHHAVTIMTSKLLRIYAFNRFISGREPEMQQLEPYLVGTKDTSPLDFRNFPELHGDISGIQKEVVGNPMYDPAGMLVALVALAAPGAAELKNLADKLLKSTQLLPVEDRVAAMKAVYNSESPEMLRKRYFGEQYFGRRCSIDVLSARRMLVLTNAGEEADAEAALWLLMLYLEHATDIINVDIVFMSGSPLLRAMRWAKVVNSVAAKDRPNVHLRYFMGPETGKPLKYHIGLDLDELKSAGLADLHERPFMDGTYNIILQASSLDGFSSNRGSPPDGPEGAIWRIKAQTFGDIAPIYIVVGLEGSANFAKDSLHQGFKAELQELGFRGVHVGQHVYVHWHHSFLEHVPASLVKFALQDEWRKAVGRIPPTAASLFIRFRVNTKVNYEVIDKASKAFEKARAGEAHLASAAKWWEEIAADVKKCIMDHYIKASRAKDNALAASEKYGNPKIGLAARASGDKTTNVGTWRSVISDACIDDLLTKTSTHIPESLYKKPEKLNDLPVDEVMALALTELTGKLLRMYACSALESSVTPNRSQCLQYVSGSQQNPPLDFYQFPRMFGDMSDTKKEVVGNPMYHTSAMLIALCCLTAPAATIDKMIKKLLAHDHILTEEERRKAILAGLKRQSQEGVYTLLETFVANNDLH